MKQKKVYYKFGNKYTKEEINQLNQAIKIIKEKTNKTTSLILHDLILKEAFNQLEGKFNKSFDLIAWVKKLTIQELQEEIKKQEIRLMKNPEIKEIENALKILDLELNIRLDKNLI